MAEADRLAQEAIRDADYYQNDVYTRSRVVYYDGGSWRCRDDRSDCDITEHKRWYYQIKNKRTIHGNKLYHLTPQVRGRYTKKLVDTGRKKYRHQYQYKTQLRQKGHYSTYILNSRTTNKYHGHRRYGTVSRSGRFKGLGSFSRGLSGYGMRR